MLWALGEHLEMGALRTEIRTLAWEIPDHDVLDRFARMLTLAGLPVS